MTPSRSLWRTYGVLAFLCMVLITGAALADTRYVPNVTNGAAPPVLPADVTLRAPAGYVWVGATPTVACAPDQSLRVSMYAIFDKDGPNRREGHTVFRVDATALTLTEDRGYFSTGARGSLTGAPITHCGYTGVLSVNLPTDHTVRFVLGS